MKRLVTEHYLLILAAVVIAVLILVGILVANNNSGFVVNNTLNYGSNPYLKMMKEDSPEKYKWMEEEKPNLDELVPEYNFKSGLVDYRLGDSIYDTETGMIENTPLFELEKRSNTKNVTALLPKSQVNEPPVVETAKNTMVPAAPVSTETVVVNMPAEVADNPPVIVPAQPGVPQTVIAPTSS